eukprot:1375273-Rhodomonas_salina.1
MAKRVGLSLNRVLRAVPRGLISRTVSTLSRNPTTHPSFPKMSEGESLLTWTGAGVKLPCSLSDLPTPALIVDEDVVIRNCEAMISKAKAAGYEIRDSFPLRREGGLRAESGWRCLVKLRPHMKTHKTIEIGKMQVGRDCVRLGMCKWSGGGDGRGCNNLYLTDALFAARSRMFDSGLNGEQVREEAAGIMASTLPEVKLFAESGFKDITYGVP